ncbi:hypothetical protein QTO34_018130 [Cnephaeus nilssonii]|uniref:Murine leukemia virus integrase C-terminal domain-containing protein n=1 Tax=Cnephaeus nilssonii TaxID=3371016 RepID=A0AA40HYA4_CNENI|nr:hypothetical protein QTO34_018130 [Eptesicus nilssonii]
MLAPELSEPLKYTPQEEEWAQQEGCCLVCEQNNAKQSPVGLIGVQCCGQATFEDLLVEGSYPVILTTSTALKVAALNTWIHHSQVKAAHQLSDAQTEWKVTSDQNIPCGSPSRRRWTWLIDLFQGIQITPC